MKRVGNLFESVISFENLLEASRLAMKGSGRTNITCRFFFDLEDQILTLQDELKENSYRPGPYRYFMIKDPKDRTIAVAPFRDRVVHHAIVRILTPVYEKVFIHDSYATRPVKGTHAAIKRAHKFLRSSVWYLKTDIEKYFASVDHEVLVELIQRKIKDREFIDLLGLIIRNGAETGKGIPIGNLTSQFLANVYLDPLDHYIKDHLAWKRYVRYMDDMVFFSDSKEMLLEIKKHVEEFLSERLILRLKPKATHLNRVSHGLSFLGMRIFPGIIRIRPENLRRGLRRLKQRHREWEQGEISEESLAQSAMSIVGHIRYFCPSISVNLEAGA